MTDAHTSYETGYTNFAIPVIQVNGKDIEADERTEGCVPFARSAVPCETHGVNMAYSLRNKYSALCHQVVTACDSGKTLEEGLQTYREHQQTRINELQVSRSGFDVVFLRF
jgi:hypothetical protein